MFIKLLSFCLFIALLVCTPITSDASEYLTMYEKLNNPTLQEKQYYSISNAVIEHHDVLMKLDSGTIAFFDPIIIDSQEIFFGGYFEGFGRFQFKPSNKMEQDQLHRFFYTDSLDRDYTSAILFFTPDIYKQLKTLTQKTENKFQRKFKKNVKNLIKKIKRDSQFLYPFEHLRNIIHPFGRGFFLTTLTPQNTENICYMYNPYLREEVYFAKEVNIRGHLYTEWINRYSQYNNDETYFNINGRDKSQLDVKSYDVISEIDKDGDLHSQATLQINVLSGPTQFIEFSLMPTLHIDSILDNHQNKILYFRDTLDGEDEHMQEYTVGLVLPAPLMFKDTLQLTFYYQGGIAVAQLGEIYIYTGSEWYPKYGFMDKATFNMKFITENKYEFVATGNQVDQKIINDKKISSWKVTSETANVSFNMGHMKKYRFEESDVVPVDIYFSKSLHAEFAQYLSKELIGTGSNMEEQVSSDIINALRVFNHYFGAYPRPRLSATEIFSNHGEAFPGFLHLGFDTWINTDTYGHDMMFRSHEVAHQWWGVDVGYETYHDIWLSEGFATYSALMYLQVVQGNEMFFNKIKEYRNDIYSVRNYIIGSGEESGPIALGPRTSSTKTKGDYSLIIYKKGAYILHMLRNMLIDLKTMNEDSFLEMMQEYYGKYRGKNVNTMDFRRIAEKYTGIDLSWFFNQWVYNNYLPESKFNYTVERDSTTHLHTVKGHIVTEKVPDDFKMFIPLEIIFENDSKAYIRLFVDSSNFSFDLPGLQLKPKKLNLNPFESILNKIKQ